MTTRAVIVLLGYGLLVFWANHNIHLFFNKRAKKRTCPSKKRMYCQNVNQQLLWCSGCEPIDATEIFLCECVSSPHHVLISNDTCMILDSKEMRRLEEPLTVLRWDDPWLVASYIALGVLAFVATIRLYPHMCRLLR